MADCYDSIMCSSQWQVLGAPLDTRHRSRGTSSAPVDLHFKVCQNKYDNLNVSLSLWNLEKLDSTEIDFRNQLISWLQNNHRIYVDEL